MIQMIDPLLVLCSVPDATKARQIGTLLLEKQLAACVTFSAVESIFVWQGYHEEAPEVLMTIKTFKELFPAVRDLISAHHPYEVPEIIGIPVTAISPAYLHWMQQSLASCGNEPALDPQDPSL
jgi:periplasmic divalent cation tolerance protein